MEEARQHPPVGLEKRLRIAVFNVGSILVLLSLVASPVLGRTVFVVLAALWLTLRTAFEFYRFLLLKRRAHSNAKWAALLGTVWLLMAIFFFKFVVIYHFAHVRTFGT